VLVKFIRFFTEHVFQDLQTQVGDVHPILQIDTIRFLYPFQNQVHIPSIILFLIQYASSQFDVAD
jgi:exportin-2 (importin alpha re-exporter)